MNWTALGFLVAFLLSTATVIYTGLLVKAPGSHRSAAPDTAAAGHDVGALSEDANDDAALQREAVREPPLAADSDPVTLETSEQTSESSAPE